MKTLANSMDSSRSTSPRGGDAKLCGRLERFTLRSGDAGASHVSCEIGACHHFPILCLTKSGDPFRTVHLQRYNQGDTQDFADGCCSSTTKAVAVDSTARLKRYHEARGIFRARRGSMSPKSRTTSLNPPALIIMSVALSDLSTGESFACGAAQLAQSNLSRLTLFAQADSGSNALLASIGAQHSPCSVTSLIKDKEQSRSTGGSRSTDFAETARGMPTDLRFSAGMPVELASGSTADRTVRAPGMRFAKGDSICARRTAAAELKTRPLA
jgi:hypothetical protein